MLPTAFCASARKAMPPSTSNAAVNVNISLLITPSS
jgi:hypothetical protein